MEEKEAIYRVRNSFKAKKSKAEILRGFQKRGYKLEYAEEILKKADKPKKILIASLIIILILVTLSSITYSIILKNEKQDLTNPFTGFVIQNNEGVKIQKESLEITPEYITFILNELGAYKLHKNPLTFKDPVISFKIGETYFTSTVKKEIKTTLGKSSDADIELLGTREEIIRIIGSRDQKKEVKSSISEGKIKLNLLASEAELFSKGYLKIYDGLK